MRLYFIIALRNLLQGKRRSLMLGSAIALVTLIHIILQSVSGGYMEGLVNGVTSVAAGHINIVGLYKYSTSTMFPLITESSRVRAIVEDALPDKTFIVERNSSLGKLVGEKRSMYIMFQGINLQDEKSLLQILKPLEVADAQGHLVSQGDINSLTKENTVLLFKSQAEKLGVTVGDQLLFNLPTLLGTNVTKLTVGAVLEDIGMLTQIFGFASRDTVQRVM
jgi:putative ABC transport system permease protein